MSVRLKLALTSVGLAAAAAGLAGVAPAGNAQTLPSTTTTSTTLAASTTIAATTTTPTTTGATVLHQSVTVTPSTTTAGATVTVSGTCEASTSGFVFSTAFVNDATHDWAGVGAAPIDTDSTGHFSTPATIAPGTPVGTYPVDVRCGGGSLAVSATVTVVAAAAAVPGTPTFTG